MKEKKERKGETGREGGGMREGKIRVGEEKASFFTLFF